MKKNFHRLHDFLNIAKQEFLEAGIENSCRNAEIICSDLLNLDKHELNNDIVLCEKHKKILWKALEKRKKNIPVQYITNKAYFYDIELFVNENVLIPRPETELLCDKVIDIADKKYKDKKEEVKILDIGIGSGAVSIVLAKHIKNAKVFGIDISKKAIKIANKNIKLNNLENKISVIYSDKFENIKNKFDIIVSNPPYVLDAEMCNLLEEVKYEPELALNGGIDGLDFYKDILGKARKYLDNKGVLIFEIHEKKAQDIIEIAKKNDFEYKELIKDYCGKDRVLVFSNQ